VIRLIGLRLLGYERDQIARRILAADAAGFSHGFWIFGASRDRRPPGPARQRERALTGIAPIDLARAGRTSTGCGPAGRSNSRRGRVLSAPLAQADEVRRSGRFS